MIPIQNVYYMLSYAFQVLNAQGYKNIATERFHNTAELMVAILAKKYRYSDQAGLAKNTIPQTEALSALRGKLDIAESSNTSHTEKTDGFAYDDFSVNGTMNRIIKATVDFYEV